MNRLNSGFTLIEILVTLAIIAIISAIAMISYSSVRREAANAKGKSLDAGIYQDIGLSLRSQWNFENGAADSFEGANNGTLISVTSVPGIKGNALSFNGSNSLVQFGSSLFSTVPSSFTVTLWADPIKLPTTEDAILFYNTRNVEFMIGYSVTGKFYVAYKLDPSGWEGLTAEAASNLNQWHHVAAVWSGTKVTLYVDGSVVGSRVPSGKKFATTASGNPAFGAFVRPSGTRNYFTGLLDEIRLYENALVQ